MSQDREKEAAELLPCKCPNGDSFEFHHDYCPAVFRPAVAAALRAAYVEVDRWKADYKMTSAQYETCHANHVSLEKRLRELEAEAKAAHVAGRPKAD